MMNKKIYFNANVVTMNPEMPNATSFMTASDRFCVVGNDEAVMTHANDGIERIDLQGKTVIPGFIESHSHISMYADQMMQVDCSPKSNRHIEDIKNRIRQKVGTSEPGTWIRGFGYDDTLIEDNRHLNRFDLDEVSPKNPIMILHVSGHLFYTNSLGLEIGGITRATPQPEGGEIDKDGAGDPTGVLRELAVIPVYIHMPLTTPKAYLEVLPKAIDYYHQNGITSCHDAGIGLAGGAKTLLGAYGELEVKNRLTLRTYLTIVENAYRKIMDMGLVQRFGSTHLRLGSVKLFQDGSIQGLTAALLEPYYNKPDLKGNLIMPQEALDTIVEKYHGMGLQVAIHANGDRAIESVIKAFERADRLHPGHGENRHMIIHCQTASDDHVRRMKALGVIPNYFVNHVYYWGDRHESLFLGPDRARRIDPLKSTLDLGWKFALHSDLPVTPVDPVFSMHTAVNRITREGKVLGPEQRISPYEALCAYTTHAAYCSFEEDIKGSIEEGKLADFAVLSDNPLTVEPEKIKEINVLQTTVGGETVWKR